MVYSRFMISRPHMMNLPVIKLPPGVLEDGVLRIDWTGYSHVLNCWRDGWHSQAWRRVLAGWESSRGFGQAIHSAMHVRFDRFGSGAYGPRCMGAMEEALKEAFTERVKCPDCGGLDMPSGTFCRTCLEKGTVERELQPPEGDHRTLGRAIEVMAEYDKLHPSESFEVLASELAGERELGMVEWELVAPAEEVDNLLRRFSRAATAREGRWDGVTKLFYQPFRCKVIWQYRIDRIVRDRDTGRVAVMDCKTTKEAQLEQVRNEFKMSPQFKLYCWAATQHLKPLDTGKWGGWNFEEVLEADVDHIIVRKPLQRSPGPNARPRNEFNRVVLTWTPGQIEECRQGVLQHLGAWLTACGRWGQAPPMTGAPRHCHQYTRTCPYLGVCEQADEGSRMGWLMGGNYVDNKWNPMEVMK
jgi:hypothetical protein